jgi:hypothetical protein
MVAFVRSPRTEPPAQVVRSGATDQSLAGGARELIFVSGDIQSDGICSAKAEPTVRGARSGPLLVWVRP